MKRKEKVLFKTIVIDGAIFVFATNKESIIIGVAEASRLIEETPSTYFFNRLYIKEQYRGKGYSKILLEEFCKKADEEKVDIELTINPYGKISYENLKELYKIYGFEEVGDNDFLRKHKVASSLI